MHTSRTALAGFLVALAACSSAAPPESAPATAAAAVNRAPEYIGGDFDTFFAPYRAAFTKVSTSASPDRQLIQLGLPDTTSVAVWYVLDKSAPEAGSLTVTVDGAPISAERVRHVRNARYKTGRVDILGLRSGTSYQIGLSGAGITPQILIARTADAGNKAFSFLFASCFVPYSTKDKEIAHIGRPERASMRNFRDRAAVPNPNGPSFFIGLGDQMYTDPGATDDDPRIAFLSGKHSERIRGTRETVPDYLSQLYRLTFGLPAMDSAFARTPSVMMWDDHDIRDGWGSQNDENHPLWREYYRNARDAFVAFQAARNPNFGSVVNARHWDPPRDSIPIADNAPFAQRQLEELHFTFDRGYATFFVADARSTKWRGPQLGGKQFEDIRQWLENPAWSNQPKVFVFAFPVPVAANMSIPTWIVKQFNTHGQDDAIDRIHLGDRKKLLELFATHFARNQRHMLVIISGDVHYSGLQSIHQGGKKGRPYGYEIISSGLAQTSYNKGGGYIATVSGFPRMRLSVPDSLTPWVQDHGLYSGPSFAELFVDAPRDASSPPRIGLEFYPAVLRNQTLILRSEPRGADWPHSITDYPKNTRAWWSLTGKTTNSHLTPQLGKFWLDAGRAVPDTSASR